MMSCQRICESQESLADCPHLDQVFCKIMKNNKNNKKMFSLMAFLPF